MSADSINKKRRRLQVFYIAAISGIILIYFAVLSAMGPVKKMKEITSEYGPKADGNELTYSDSAYLSLFKEKSWFQTKSGMAKTDSIYLTINLADSTANLEISGVVVHSARISSYKLSSILNKGEKYPVYSLLSRPLTISESIATIRKEPLMIKIAPKDTSEYEPDIIPDTSIVEHVNFILHVSDSIRIHVYQEEYDKPAKKGSTFRFDLNDRLLLTWQALKSAATLKVPEYHPYVKITIPREDVKIIYRALPRKGQVALYT